MPVKSYSESREVVVGLKALRSRLTRKAENNAHAVSLYCRSDARQQRLGLSFGMDPTLSGFALGLLLGAAKVGFIGTVGFGIAWWRTRAKLRRLESALPDPDQLEARLANLEQLADYSAAKLDRLVEGQQSARQLQPPWAIPAPTIAERKISPCRGAKRCLADSTCCGSKIQASHPQGRLGITTTRKLGES